MGCGGGDGTQWAIENLKSKKFVKLNELISRGENFSNIFHKDYLQTMESQKIL